MSEFKVVFGRIGSDIWVNSRLGIIRDLVRARNKKILDYGCGPGYMGSNFSKENHVIFSDIDKTKMSGLSGDRVLLDARYPPLKNNAFDWVICAGVLEHIKEDKLVLENIYSLLKEGGKALITLPAFSCFYGKHDEYIDHYRRYDRDVFIRLAKLIGFKVDFVRYTNSLMFPAFAFSNKFLGQTKTYRGTSRMERKLMPLLKKICWIERKFKFPFGIGLIFILSKSAPPISLVQK